MRQWATQTAGFFFFVFFLSDAAAGEPLARPRTHNPVNTHQAPAHTHTHTHSCNWCRTWSLTLRHNLTPTLGEPRINIFFIFFPHSDTSDGKLIARRARKIQTPRTTAHPPPPYPSHPLLTLLHLNCIFVHLIRLRMDRQLRRRAKQEIWQLLKGSVLINYHLRNKLRRLRRFQSLHGNKGA